VQRAAELERLRDQQIAEHARMRQDLETAEAISANLRRQFEGSEEMVADAATALDRLERAELELALLRSSAMAAAKELVMQLAAARAIVDPNRAADAMRALGRLSRHPPADDASSMPPPVPPPPGEQEMSVSVTVGVEEADESEFLEEGYPKENPGR
jgi:hypothetical protein